MNASVILRTATRALIPLLIVFALLLLLRGHHQPGGGFVAGLTAGGAFALHRMAFGGAALERLLRVSPVTIVAIGLLIAGVSSAIPLFVGGPLMQALWIELGSGPNALHLGTPLLFDVGVALVVVGFATLALFALDSDHE